MKIYIENRDSYKYIEVLEERLDIFSAPVLKMEILNILQVPGNKNIVLDIASCSYCDASGLGAIQVIQSMCKKQEGILWVTGINTYIENLIKICMLDLEWKIGKGRDDVEKLFDEGTENGLIAKCA